MQSFLIIFSKKRQSSFFNNFVHYFFIIKRSNLKHLSIDLIIIKRDIKSLNVFVTTSSQKSI